jgi:hypothetical protein
MASPALSGNASSRRWHWAIVVAVLMGMTASASSQSISASTAALQLRDATPTRAQTDLLQPFSLDARSDWHYTPRRRGGVAWRDMSQPQRDAATALLRSALTANGLDKVRAVMALEIALRELETFGPERDPGNYAIAIYGEPNAGAGPWGWRIEGHHLSLHWTLQGDRYVATLPQFFGANPARAPRDFGSTCAPARACSARKKTAHAPCSLRCRRRSAPPRFLTAGPTATSCRATPRKPSRPNPTASISDH